MAERAETEFELDWEEFKKRKEKEKLKEKQEKQAEDEQAEAKTVVYSEMTAADRPFFQWLKKTLVMIFIMIFLGACVWQVNALKKESAELDKTMAQLEKQIEEEKAKELEIKVEKEFYQSIAYREQMARDRCKLIYPNEILISIQNKK